MTVSNVYAALAATAAFLLLSGCGRSANTPASAAPIAARPDVVITFDGKRHTCSVALYSEANGSSVSCGDVVPFVRDELRLSSGSIYEIRAAADVDEAEISKVDASLKGAGYRFIGGPRKDR
jgi:hypothetical protein